MTVGDLMTRANVLTAREDDDLALASQMMLWAGIRHLPVTRDGAVVGVLSERDLLALHVDSDRQSARRRIGDVMQRTVSVATPDEEVSAAAARMIERNIGCLPVVERGELVGILTRTDVLAGDARRPAPAEGATGLRVHEVMKRDPATVHAQRLLVDAAALMVSLGVRHLPVVDDRGRLIGMLSDRDVRARIGDPTITLRDPERRERALSLRVWAATVTPAVAVPLEASLGEAVGLLIDHRIGAVIVIDTEERPVGILSYVDALRALTARAP